MDISNYIISTTTDDNRVILFSTLTTAFIILSKEEYPADNCGGCDTP